MTKRKFYRAVISVEVLSEEPFEYNGISDIRYAITQGDCSGRFVGDKRSVLDGKQCARALRLHGSDPAFFRLDDKGDDLET